MSSPPQPMRVARPVGPLWLQRVAIAAALAYLGMLFLNGAGDFSVRRMVPPSIHYFSQVSCLFPRSRTHIVDYRVEVYDCEARDWREIDHRPYFPIHPNDKENRLHRVGFFYRKNLKVLRALEDYLVTSHNAALAAGTADDGVTGPIGGIHLLSLRFPVTEVGTPLEPWSRPPLETLPREIRKTWYRSPRKIRMTNCRDAATADDADGDTEDDAGQAPEPGSDDEETEP